MTECRMPPIAEKDFTAAQKQAQDEFVAERKVPFSGPWHVFVRSPELLMRTHRVGEFLRYRCSLSGRLSEFCILMVARHWSQDYEWGAHRKHALAAGVTEASIAAIRDGRRPSPLADDEQTIWDFVSELLATRRVSDATYAAAKARFGENGVVELCGLVGYYSMLAMTMNVARVEPPEGETALPRFPE
ncbi:carboxymuconolactone decarboxylase family protein [Roseiarcaceae bacterium H3SJ34-1]|uniref:carboxymuconolactone decarboxylase family protein n=1 Tax=Terripilifer ovatus TaxID=3032367 RepID=UPI003AB94F92|nr:carboxymuconolactone decarboxylase family protein [Roseiarcaceae bacterium H3SJ34-1]